MDLVLTYLVAALVLPRTLPTADNLVHDPVHDPVHDLATDTADGPDHDTTTCSELSYTIPSIALAAMPIVH